MDLRSDSLDFSMPLSGSGPRTANKTVIFPRAVNAATAGLTGYTVAYSGDDHHVGRIEVRLDASINSNTVTVTGTFGLRDWSGNWDDQYDGTIEFTVIADLESATAPPPRADLVITDLELNQATQFFRTSQFLDPGNVRPDNSIFLIARKNTGLRFYVDWDSSAGLPPITNLTGPLTVRTGSTTLTLPPINPGQAITPKRAVNIVQALANDTLNFMIPAAWCTGTVEISLEVFDQASPVSKSGAFTRTLVFVAVAPLNLFLVGVGLTTPATPAPSQSAVSGALSVLVKTYPRGDINLTGFTTINFTENLLGCPTSDCGSGFSDLLDRLKDLKGGSSDIYFGGLPAGVSGAAGNCILGCSPTGDGVAAAFIDIPLTVPHEVGHALGRKHDPCTSCSPPAQDPDSNYPQYDNFNSDSIGVFGFDPTTNTVFNPAATLDFMTAFLPASGWVSPYTYRALLSNVVGGPSPSGGSPCTNPHAIIETLFLGLQISREREVRIRPSFHYPAPLQGRSGCKSRFTVEFLDEKRTVLDCAHLHCRCTSGDCPCWPKVFRDALLMPGGARWMVVWEDEKKIHEEPIPNPPTVKITGAQPQEGGVLLQWASEPADDVWYLVHWFDRVRNVFRGVAPRLQQTSLLIPKALFTHGTELKVRVLATQRIATGVAEQVIQLPNYQPAGGTVGLAGVDPNAKGAQQIPGVLTLVATDTSGRQLSEGQATWYDGRGAEIARGNQVDLRQLGSGKQVVRVVVRAPSGRLVAKSWLVERTAGGWVLHHPICDPATRQTLGPHTHPHPATDSCLG